MSGRTNDPLAKMTAERDEAIRRFEASEKLEKEAIKQRGKEYRRAERYKNELKTLKQVTGVAGGDSVISEIESSSRVVVHVVQGGHHHAQLAQALRAD